MFAAVPLMPVFIQHVTNMSSVFYHVVTPSLSKPLLRWVNHVDNSISQLTRTYHVSGNYFRVLFYWADLGEDNAVEKWDTSYLHLVWKEIQKIQKIPYATRWNRERKDYVLPVCTHFDVAALSLWDRFDFCINVITLPNIKDHWSDYLKISYLGTWTRWICTH